MLNWQLPVGEYFDQDGWSGSKTLRPRQRSNPQEIPAAKLSNTQATVNPNNNTADLNVMAESNRPIYFRRLEITGTRRYPRQRRRRSGTLQTRRAPRPGLLARLPTSARTNGHYPAHPFADFDRPPRRPRARQSQRH